MVKITYRLRAFKLNSRGFSIIELLIACVIVPFLVLGISTAYNSIRNSYVLARQFNEMYAVLSACPELDRALEFSSLSSSTNCYPNNSFAAENSGNGTVTYTPVLTVQDTSSLASSDPLKTIPDSKIISISVGYPAPNTGRPPLQLRMLITNNGIGQQ
jgi:hypothetical protein